MAIVSILRQPHHSSYPQCLAVVSLLIHPHHACHPKEFGYSFNTDTCSLIIHALLGSSYSYNTIQPHHPRYSQGLATVPILIQPYHPSPYSSNTDTVSSSHLRVRL
jgi:hypothetical protein